MRVKTTSKLISLTYLEQKTIEVHRIKWTNVICDTIIQTKWDNKHTQKDETEVICKRKKYR